MHEEEEHEAQPRPRVVALLPNTNEGRHDEEENWAGRGWDLDQAERVGGWWDSDACTTGRGGGLDPACALAGEDVGSHLAERVRRLLSEKGLHEGREEAQGVMTIGQYAAAFPWLRASEQCALAPPSALLPPDARRTMMNGGGGREEVPYLADFVLGRTAGGMALLRDLAQPALPPCLEDWPSRHRLVSLEAPHPLTGPDTPPFAYLFLGPRGARSRLHTDDHSTHGWLLQLAGRKKVWLWPPGAFPYHSHTPHEVILEPWHMLYIPFRWACVLLLYIA